MLSLRLSFYSLVIICLLVSAAPPALAKDTPQSNETAKILFIGNSYTYWVEDILKFVLERSENDGSLFEFHTRGSTPLAYFAEDAATLKKIREGGFSYVVLQEWSRGVGRKGESADQFEDSLLKLNKVIRESGAEPLLYMTWGRDDFSGYKSYADMNAKIVAGYEQAAERHKVGVLAVGKVWGALREKDEEFGLSFYEDSIGHPSTKGQIVVASVFFKALFNDPLAWDYLVSDVLSPSQWLAIKEATERFVTPLQQNIEKTNIPAVSQ